MSSSMSLIPPLTLRTPRLPQRALGGDHQQLWDLCLLLDPARKVSDLPQTGTYSPLSLAEAPEILWSFSAKIFLVICMFGRLGCEEAD
jgi:hypothetical protein